MTRFGMLAIGLLGLAASLSVACGDDDDVSTNSTTPTQAGTVTISAMDSLSFSPSRAEVNLGEPAHLVIDNTDSAILHDWTIEEISVEDVSVSGAEGGEHNEHGADTGEYDLHVAVDGGETGSIDFTPLEAGEYEFICTVTGHAGSGMRGTLVVSP